MASKVKLQVANQIIEILKLGDNPRLLNGIAPFLKLNQQMEEDNAYSFIIDTNHCRDLLNTKNCYGLLELKQIGVIDHVEECSFQKLKFTLNPNTFVRNVLDEEGIKHAITREVPDKKNTVIVEFSSPNIAKPFHFGHLRSTVVGNFVANITEYMQNNVIRMNYLGDWGTQFGMLKVGLNLTKTTAEDIRKNPIKTLYEAYVHANKLKEQNADIENQAEEIFHKMEYAELEDDMKEWETYRKYTMDEIAKIYNRLGVVFDKYSWESEYSAKHIAPIIDMMRKIGYLEDGRLVADIDGLNIPLLKSDNSTLYLTRDVAAAIDRYERYKFHSMLYVVGSTQIKHFKNLSTCLHKMGFDYISKKIRHVRFGHVIGLSSRKGNAIFLDDILNEAKDAMTTKQMKAYTTKVEPGGEIADILGISMMIVHNLRMKRNRDFNFNWNFALDPAGNTGVQLQYTHCRLHSLEDNCGVSLPDVCDPTVLCDPSAMMLINEIARFEEIIDESFKDLESRVLVLYLFQLCMATNKALTVLRVKGEDSHVASQRLLLFNRARIILNLGMKILGLKPLTQM